ncbi:MAG: hypothetical protein A3F12_07715 [Gammaproteobacteria bacterium RIFCSPHIGHO2_12_FULL_38_14]|nr:MAG: hypothetical protein A3F12_07715 [Gammaproteobacteria bacterium RIFCSPHIGHO2_12_FULL_38_14]
MNIYPVYLDYAASTPLDSRVKNKMLDVMNAAHLYANPSSLHIYGQKAKALIDTARLQIASYVGAEASEIIFTSGATESINLAIKGVASLLKRKGHHIITVKTEHKAVLDTCQHLEKIGYRVTYLTPHPTGRIDLDELLHAFSQETILVSVMQVNNETGVIQDLDAIAEATSSRSILLHVDAAQSIGKCKLDVSRTPIDLISFSSHKVYGPKGIGALYLRKKPRVRVEPLLHGGGHELGMRSGTLATHQIVGMGEAFQIAQQDFESDVLHIQQLHDKFLQALRMIRSIQITGDLQHKVPHILNIRFEGLLADALLNELSDVMAVSTGSACQTKEMSSSHVLRAMGLSTEQIKSAIRFSFGRLTTQDDISFVIDKMIKIFTRKS